MADDGARQRVRRRAWLLAALAFVGVTAVMLYPMPAGGGPSGWPHIDKLVHFGAWLVLAVTLWPVVRGRSAGDAYGAARVRWGRAVALVVALGLWGVAVELMQGLVPPRTPDAWDALADLIGALVGTAAMTGRDGWQIARGHERVAVERPIEETSS